MIFVNARVSQQTRRKHFIDPIREYLEKEFPDRDIIVSDILHHSLRGSRNFYITIPGQHKFGECTVYIFSDKRKAEFKEKVNIGPYVGQAPQNYYQVKREMRKNLKVGDIISYLFVDRYQHGMRAKITEIKSNGTILATEVFGSYGWKTEWKFTMSCKEFYFEPYNNPQHQVNELVMEWTGIDNKAWLESQQSAMV